jgi:tetratricopeptide (TPR) repeat protein
MLAGEYQLRKQVNLYRDRVNQAILADPRSPLGYRALAVSWLFNLPLDFDLAEKYMVEYASLRPGEAIALLSVGDVCRAKMQFLKAYTAYTTALQLDPLSGVGLSKRGYMNTYLGQLNEARSDFEKANSLTGGGSQIEAPNNNLVCFFFCGNVKRAAEELQKMHSPASVSVPSKNKGVQRVADHHRFCCSMIAQTHGIYTATNASDDECCCLQKDFTRESYPPDKETIDALFAFVESMRALDSKNYELAAQKAEEYALILQPGVRPEKSQVYQYLMGVISFRQDHYHSAVSHFLKSDLTNNCVKFDLALAYDKLGEFEKAGEMMKDVSGCVFTSSYTPDYVQISQRYLKKVAMLPEE